MAWTIKLINNQGTLAVIDDERGKIGTGRAKPSTTEPGYITLTLNVSNHKVDMKTRTVRLKDFIVMRVPINWLEEGK